MHPDQPYSPAPPPANNYDFILNPQQAPKHSMGKKFMGNSFLVNIAAIVGGALLLMAVLAVAITLFFGNKTNVDDLVTIAQTEQEIVRLSEAGDATDQATKNATVTTQFSVQSQQQQWLTLIKKNGRTIAAEELALKKNTSTDKQLASAAQNGTYDTVYASVMRDHLTAYTTLLKNTYARSSNKTIKALLNTHYKEAQLLLQQWPK
jgi:hypothetical protein